MLLSRTYRFLSAACCALLVAACSGGSSGTSSSSGGSSSGGTTVTTESLQSVNNLPDFNIDSLDATANASVSSPQLTLNQSDDGETEERRFSRAGCEIRSCVEEFKYHLKELRSNVCIIKKMESEAGMTVGDGEYAYYNMEFEAGEAPGDTGDSGYDCDTDCSALSDDEQTICEEVQASLCFSFAARVRVGVIDDTLHMALCTNEATGSTFQQVMAMTFTVDEEAGHFDGIVKDIFPSYLDSTQTDAFSIEASLATDDPEEFSDGDTASFLAQMNSLWGSGHIGLDVEKDGGNIKNTVDAAFRSGSADADWGSWTSQVFGIYDSEEGCSTWAAEGSYPGMAISDAFDSTMQAELAEAGYASDDIFCWVKIEEDICNDEDGCTSADFIEAADENGMCSYDETGPTECFSFEVEAATLDLDYFVIDPATDGTYYTDVDSHGGLDDFSEPTIAFEGDEEWDCLDADGSEAGFTEIDPSAGAVADAFETCFAMEEDTGRSIESCYDQENEEFAEDELEVDFEDNSQEYGGDAEGGEGDGGGDEEMPDVSCETDCSQAGENEDECVDYQINTLGCD